MNKTIGFIGCGNMASAMIGGIVDSSLVEPEEIIASNRSSEKLEDAKIKFGIRTTLSNIEVAKEADVLVLAIKPHLYHDVLKEIRGYTKSDVIVITIAAGVTIEYMEHQLGEETKIARTMPNTPALVGMGLSAYCVNHKMDIEDKELVKKIFASFGEVEELEEKLMDFVPAVSGSSPAYVYMFIEALADGAVLDGIPREKAYKMAAQAVMGAAKMVLETGKHPGKLKDEVCSPGGTTIEAISELEKTGFRGSVLSAMKACTKKCIELKK